MTPEREDYNGWTNRETWAFNLYFGHDDGLLLTANDAFVQNLQRLTEDQPNWPQEWRVSAAMQYAGDAVEEWYDELAPDLPRDTLRDIGSAWRINWREVAANASGSWEDV